jgi:hypothetical protein
VAFDQINIANASIRRKLVELDFEALQDFGNESMRRKSKANAKECLEDHQLALRF